MKFIDFFFFAQGSNLVISESNYSRVQHIFFRGGAELDWCEVRSTEQSAADKIRQCRRSYCCRKMFSTELRAHCVSRDSFCFFFKIYCLVCCSSHFYTNAILLIWKSVPIIKYNCRFLKNDQFINKPYLNIVNTHSHRRNVTIQCPTSSVQRGCGSKALRCFIRIKSIFVSIRSQMVRQVIQNIQHIRVYVVKGDRQV